MPSRRLPGSRSSVSCATIGITVCRSQWGQRLSFPTPADPPRTLTVVVRTRLPDPHTLFPAIRRAIREIDPAVPAFRVQTLEEVVWRSLWRQRLQGQVLG